MNSSRNHGTDPLNRSQPRMGNSPAAGRNGKNGSKKDHDADIQARIATYENRAQELRDISDALKTLAARETVRLIALEYEHMAAALRKRTHH